MLNIAYFSVEVIGDFRIRFVENQQQQHVLDSLVVPLPPQDIRSF